MTRDNGSKARKDTRDDDAKVKKAVREVRKAVRDVPDPAERPVTREDVKKLREADLDEIAEVAERYVAV
jgi:hypothetical protein